jgi:hypothetical protein
MANKKGEKEEKLEKLEGGFSLYVNGAHKSSEKYTPRHTTASKTSTDKKSNFHFTPRIHVRKNPLDNLKELAFISNKDRAQSAPNKPVRKKWGDTPSFTIKTVDGYEIKINAPNEFKSPMSKSSNTANSNKNKSHDCEYYYSDDFESESGGEDEEDEVEEMDEEKKSKEPKCILQSVKFSDDSDLEDNVNVDKRTMQSNSESNNKNKKIFLKLTNRDIKVSWRKIT